MPTNLLGTPDEVAGALRRIGAPEPVVEALLADSRPGLVLQTVPEADDMIPVGASKFGGSPDLPPGYSWPHRPAYANADTWVAWCREGAASYEDMDHGREYLTLAELVVRPFPLAFIAQMDLTQFAPSWGYDPSLPTEGRLLFFYDYRANPLTHGPEASIGWKLVWDTTPVDQLIRASPPAILQTLNETRFVDDRGTARLEAYPVTCVLPPDDFDVDGIELDDVRSGEEYLDIWSRLYEKDQAHGSAHQLGGWPQPLQYCLREYAEHGRSGRPLEHIADTTPSDEQDTEHGRSGRPLIYILDSTPSDEYVQSAQVREWQLLLQINLDEPNRLFQNGGMIYVMMRERDMRSRAFDQAWVVYQDT